jgi:hypothetical protein
MRCTQFDDIHYCRFILISFAHQTTHTHSSVFKSTTLLLKMADQSKLYGPTNASMFSFALAGQHDREQIEYDIDYIDQHTEKPMPPSAPKSFEEEVEPAVGNRLSRRCDAHDVRVEMSAHPWANGGRGEAPMDGPKPKPVMVWFCSECGDGPNGDWRNQCLNCDHKRCSCCNQAPA